MLQLTRVQIEDVANAFRQAMEDGLAQRQSPLKMLPSFLDIPTEPLTGTYAAVDFGGSNLRALEVTLAGRTARIDAFCKKPLPPAADGREVFAYIAAMVQEVAPRSSYLGHTFSYPCLQLGVNQARLLQWTKEVSVAGVEGQDVNAMLAAALHERGLAVKPAAILNDTVGTLLTAAFCDPQADIAVICGTGYNACYREPCRPSDGRPMIINMESGNFDKLPYTSLDHQLDAASERPGAQRLEKMAAGAYLGELVRLGILALLDKGSLWRRERFFTAPYALSSEDVAVWLSENSAAGWRLERGLPPLPQAEDEQLVALSRGVVRRSAQLVAATCLGVISHIDPALVNRHVIAIDGSLYEKMPGYAAAINETLQEVLGDAHARVEARLVKDGSGIGAAIAAAIASREAQ